MNLKKIFSKRGRIKDSSSSNYSYDVYCGDDLIECFLTELDAQTYTSDLSQLNRGSNVAIVYITFDNEGYITSEETLWSSEVLA